jgi:hypothetical protein
MEIIKLNATGYYFYCPDLQIENYDKHLNKKKLLNECAICKRFILEPSYDSITNSHNIVQESDITIGKCGHMFHSDCINSWLKTNNTCPIDKVAWQTFRIADSFTKLVLKDEKTGKLSNSSNKQNYFNKQVNKFYPNKYNKMIQPIKNMKKSAGNYPGEVETKANADIEVDMEANIIQNVEEQNQILQPIEWNPIANLSWEDSINSWSGVTNPWLNPNVNGWNTD